MSVYVELDSTGTTMLVRAPARYKELTAGIPGSYYSAKDSVWRIPVSWTAGLAIKSTYREELEVGPELKAWMANEYSTRILPSFQLKDVEYLEEGDQDLYPHQRAGVQYLATAKRAILADEPGLGKALAMSEKVLTPSGFIPMSEITEGSYVVGQDGTPTRVVGVYPQGVRDIYRVTFSDGATADVDAEHLWTVENARTGFSRTVTTQWMLDKGLRRSDGHRKFRIPMVKPVEFIETSIPPVDPYTLGVILGDGSVDQYGRTRVSSSDKDVLSFIEEAGQPLTFRGKYDYYLPKISPVMRLLGLNGKKSYDKFVPLPYLRGSVETRMEVIRGLMDSDGWISKDGSIVQYTSVSQELISGMTDLVRSLGGIARLSSKPVPKNGNYIVYNLTLNTPFNPFKLPRKAALWAPRNKYPASRYVDSIVFSRREEAQCIEVDAKDHLFVMNDYVVTHNTAQAIRALAELERRGENPFPALVVCPNTIKTNWKREFEKWLPGTRVQVINGTPAQRRKQFDTWYKAENEDERPQVFVINWESLRTHSRLSSFGNISLTSCKEHGGIDEKITAARCEKHPKELNGIEFGAVIADEIHRAKDARAKQSRALLAASGNAEIRFALTGTPIGESVVDLWSILHWVNEKEWPTKTKWMDRMVDSVENMFGGIYVTGVKAHMKEEFFSSVDPRMRRMLKKAVLDFLPPIIYEERFVEMLARQKKAYKDMKKHMMAEVEGGFALATSPLVQMGRLVQFAVAYAEVAYDEKTGEEYIRMSEPSATLDAMMDDITSGDFGEDSVAISAGGPGSRQILELLSARLTKAGIRHGMITGGLSADVRQKSIDEFQSGEIKYILYTVQAGGVGVTLTRARRLLRIMRPFSLIDDIQSNDRVHRIGSEIHDSIIITDYVVADSVQQRVQEILGDKAEQAEEVMRDQEKLLRFAQEAISE